MIRKIDHQDLTQANNIWSIFQQSYQIEADLIGAKDFPPLRRTSEDIQLSVTDFYGAYRQEALAGVIEVIGVGNKLEICSLVVSPSHFRQGVGGDLIGYVLNFFNPKECEIETATANIPAIALYKRHGFEAQEIWMTSFGIEKIKLIKG